MTKDVNEKQTRHHKKIVMMAKLVQAVETSKAFKKNRT
jgi:hypothetical protein